MDNLVKVAIVISLFFTFQNCINSGRKNSMNMSDSSISAVSQKSGKYLIDSTVINTNKNLENFLQLIRTTEMSFVSEGSIPHHIKSFLRDIHKGEFWLAQGSEVWNSSGVTIPGITVPNRKLQHMAINPNLSVIIFLEGGAFATRKIYLIRTDRKRIIDFWFGIASEITTIEQLKNFLELKKSSTGAVPDVTDESVTTEIIFSSGWSNSHLL